MITLRHIHTILRVPSLEQYSNLCPHTHTTITCFHIPCIMYMPSCACYYKIYTCSLYTFSSSSSRCRCFIKVPPCPPRQHPPPPSPDDTLFIYTGTLTNFRSLVHVCTISNHLGLTFETLENGDTSDPSHLPPPPADVALPANFF